MKAKIFLILPFLLFFIGSNHSYNSTNAGSYRWKQLGPRGGFVREIVPDRSQPNVWYTVTDFRLYRSGDFGKTWTKILDNISQVTVHPYTSEVLAFGFAFETRRFIIWHGSKSGRSWRPSRLDWINTLTWDQYSSKRVYATANGEFLESLDGGYTWSIKGKFPTSDEYGDCFFVTKKILVSPLDKHTLYIFGYIDCEYCCSHDEMKVSTDNGRTWKSSDYKAANFYWDPFDPHRAFAANCSNVAELTTKGWKAVAEVNVNMVVGVPKEPNHFYASGGCGSPPTIMESKDDCKTWKIVDHLQSNVAAMSTVDDSQQSLLVGTYGGGIFKRFGTGSWKSSTQGFEAASMYRIARSAGGKMIYGAAGYGEVLFKKSDSKNYWTGILPGPRLQNNERAELLVANPKDENNAFLVTHDRTLVTKNGGLTWRNIIGLGKYYRVEDLVFDNPSRPRVVYAISGSALLSSKDNGIHFERVANLRASDYLNLIRIIVDAGNDRLLCVVSNAGIFKSIDGGKSFKLIEAPRDVEVHDAALLGHPDHFLIVSQGDVYRTLDSGLHWEKISHLPLDFSWEFLRLMPADNEGKRFIVRLEDGRSKFLESNDGGASWTIQSLASDTYINDISDPRSGPICLATNKGVLMQK